MEEQVHRKQNQKQNHSLQKTLELTNTVQTQFRGSAWGLTAKKSIRFCRPTRRSVAQEPRGKQFRGPTTPKAVAETQAK